jgi:hypothetical protein
MKVAQQFIAGNAILLRAAVPLVRKSHAATRSDAFIAGPDTAELA